MILAGGILYMGQYSDNLVRAELESLKSEAKLYAGALSEGAVRAVYQYPSGYNTEPLKIKAIKPDLAVGMVRTLAEKGNSRIKLFNVVGETITDSHLLKGPGGVVEVETLQAQEPGSYIKELFFKPMADFLELIPMQKTLPLYPIDDLSPDFAYNFEDTQNALNGEISATAWERSNKEFILTAAAPIQDVKKVIGVVFLTRDGHDLRRSIEEVRVDIFRVFLGAFGITIMLSVYLSGLITQPLQRLATAAEAVRMGKGRQVEIPDMSDRNDEIGELSLVIRDMTQALYDRMDAVEAFAADVAHEIKNPLTSVRSAVETAVKVKDEEARKKLMDIILHDVQRLDRLISDISSASRLDAELSREELEIIDLKTLLEQLIDAYKQPLARVHAKDTNKDNSNIQLSVPDDESFLVLGNGGRLSQVFGNLISNALSFSPPDKSVSVTVHREPDSLLIQVEDEGPGIPENKLEAVFERFYTERPQSEGYGSHSGLGLAISRQIIKAHGGEIWAENRVNEAGKITGARFTVRLQSA